MTLNVNNFSNKDSLYLKNLSLQLHNRQSFSPKYSKEIHILLSTTSCIINKFLSKCGVIPLALAMGI